MQEHEDSLTRSIIKDAERIGTDYRCLSRDEKLVLSTIYFYGTHGRCFVTINTIIDVMSNIWNPTIYLNKGYCCCVVERENADDSKAPRYNLIFC